MATITTIAAGDLISNSRADLNTNFANLNSDKIETSVIDTDTTLAANSDSKLPSQKAVKAYVDAGGNVNASTTLKGIVEEATAAEVAAKTATGGTGARLYMNPSTAGAFFPNTTVFADATPPNTYTDLDLSAVVGTGQRMVMLKVTYGTTNGTAVLQFRRNGETAVVQPSAGISGTTNLTLTTTANIGFVIVSTDTSGIVEWINSSAGYASQTIAIAVEAYW